MSEPIPESIPTATSRLSHRPTKKSKPSGAAISAQSHSLAVLFANADREIIIPASSSSQTAVSKESALSAAPELVANVQGSSAGAGSGEFHVYKASRRREYERLKAMDAEVQRETDEKEWERRKEEGEKKESKRMNRNKARREKAKERKAAAAIASAGEGEDGEGESASGASGEKKLGGRLGIRKGLWAGETGRNIAAKADEEAEANAHPAVDEVGLTIHDDED